jgi:uncharacterized protein YjiS (DUF1127 family)
VGEILARRTVVQKMLHSLVDAIGDGLAAHWEYERLIAKGVRHDPALKAALSETNHCRKAPARRTAIQSAFLSLVAAVGAWIDRRSEQKTLARLDKHLLHDAALTRSEHSETRVKPLSLAGTV